MLAWLTVEKAFEVAGLFAKLVDGELWRLWICYFVADDLSDEIFLERVVVKTIEELFACELLAFLSGCCWQCVLAKFGEC